MMMNRLFLIGNGFDLAHGLPTSYGDFISDYWGSIDTYNYSDSLVELNAMKNFDFADIKNFKNLYDILSDQKKYFGAKANYEKLSIVQYTAGVKKERLLFKNDFFRVLNQLDQNVGWVDIEKIYYTLLKSLINKNVSYNYNKNVRNLNNEFNEVRQLLRKYLNQKIIQKFDFTWTNRRDWLSFYPLLKPFSLFNNESNVMHEFSDEKDRQELTKLFDEQKNNALKHGSKSYFLNFNYTPTLEIYIDKLLHDKQSYYLNYIHGTAFEDQQEITFGFGDEMDEDYKLIESKDDNEFLRFFKSFKYLQDSNYQNLLNFISSSKFQVCIIGHSCGLSDRTLLNTIFEHDNCRSIKIFYHQYASQDNYGQMDNFTEIVQNISRHFNNKKIMREKIVNKKLSKPLPQITISTQQKFGI